ncbi:hypothetical protein EMEDMD4_600019 [Sinorhizobium medicae]|uniref:Uncharacterized protein n=1 Tax=Sinorhizobium medicae TaxID=110321 RepID=A0A508X9A4_9HYPH|nr:hypothetical protein EMEDMD4_600019 [Sinorhizobium medicae]
MCRSAVGASPSRPGAYSELGWVLAVIAKLDWLPINRTPAHRVVLSRRGKCQSWKKTAC